MLTAGLDSTHATLGAIHNVSGRRNLARFLEFAVGQIGLNTFDGINLSVDRKTVFVILSTQLSLDQVRIITAVPEPATNTLFALGGLALSTTEPRAPAPLVIHMFPPIASRAR